MKLVSEVFKAQILAFSWDSPLRPLTVYPQVTLHPSDVKLALFWNIDSAEARKGPGAECLSEGLG